MREMDKYYDTKADFEVRKTNDYSKFKKLLGNREVQEKRVTQLMTSIKENGFLNSSIIVNEKMEIIDGQARCEALKRLEMPIFYCIHKGAGLKECIDLNIKQGNWTLADYCGSYAANGNENYIRLIKLMNTVKTQYSSCYAIAWGRIASGGFGTDDIKNGKAIISEKQYNQVLMCKDLIDLVTKKKPKGHELRLELTAFAYAFLTSGADQKRIMLIINEKMAQITPYHTPDLILGEITRLYNKGLPKEKRISFDGLYKMQVCKEK